MERAVNSSSHFDTSTARQSFEISSSQSVHNLYHGMKKSRRLTLEQVRALEESFQLGNMLETRRKEELAGALGLHPRQIGVWFQNRRARLKTKQLEKDLGVLKQEYESFKARYHTLLEENTTLQSEMQRLRSKNDENKKDKEVMGDGQIDFNIVQEIKEEICCGVSNGEDNITQQASIEETCGQNSLLALEEEDCYYNMGERSGFMFVDDHWTPSFQ